jgi:hypothetical protein
MQQIWNMYNGDKMEEAKENDEVVQANDTIVEEVKPITEEDKTTKRKRIEEKEQYTLQLLLELNAKANGRTFLPEDFTILTGRSYTTEARYLKILWERNLLNREWKNRQYYYTLNNATTTS